jgi:hypothetical protein
VTVRPPSDELAEPPDVVVVVVVDRDVVVVVVAWPDATVVVVPTTVAGGLVTSDDEVVVPAVVEDDDEPAVTVVVDLSAAFGWAGVVLQAASARAQPMRQTARQPAWRTAAGYSALADAWFESGPVPTLLVAATS